MKKMIALLLVVCVMCSMLIVTEVDDAGGNGHQESGECPQVPQYK